MISKSKGSILITTLWIMAILSLLAMGIGFRSSLEVRLGKYNMDKLKARYLAKAGVIKAEELLANDRNEKYDSLYECGISLKFGQTPQNLFSSEFNKLDDGAFSIFYVRKDTETQKDIVHYGMLDEERKININMEIGTPDTKNEFKKILGRLSPILTEEVIEAIIDWRDKDSLGDAESTYYESLERPYTAKNANFDIVEELLLVKGVNYAIFNEIKDFITVYTDGAVNINTAPEEVLHAMIEDDDIVEIITSYRKSGFLEEETIHKNYFEDLNEVKALLRNKGINESRIANNIDSRFTCKSANFRITSWGESGKIRKKITYIIEKETGEVKYYHES